jgi:hypothetical protein
MGEVVLREGLVKRIHIDKHVIKRGGKHPITIQTSKGPIKTDCVRVSGDTWFIYRPDKPLKCGAKVWAYTRSEVSYDE